MFAPKAPVPKQMTDQKAYEDAGAAGIDPPASFDANFGGLDPPPLGTCGITVGKRGVAAAEIGIALAQTSMREALRDSDGACQLKSFPKRFGVAENRYGLRITQMRMNIHEADFASEE